MSKVFFMLALVVILVTIAWERPRMRPAVLAYAAGGEVSGLIWRDDDGDGQRQSGEPGVAFPVQLRNMQTGQSLKATSSTSGLYSFPGLMPGNYVAEVDVGPDSGYGTFPVRQVIGLVQTGVVVNESTVGGVNFGIFPIEKVPRFLGSVTIDGSRAATRPVVEASVGGKSCSAAVGLLPPNADIAYYHVAVFPAELVPGCGVSGSPVTFRVNGRPANETAIWHPAGIPLADGLLLTVGNAEPGTIGVRPPVTGDAGLR